MKGQAANPELPGHRGGIGGW